MDTAKEKFLFTLSRENNLDFIQKYVEENVNVDTFDKQDVGNEMFRLFFNVMELGKEIRSSSKSQDYQNTELKIADIFLVLLFICNNLQINLFDALSDKEKILNGKVAKWF